MPFSFFLSEGSEPILVCAFESMQKCHGTPAVNLCSPTLSRLNYAPLMGSPFIAAFSTSNTMMDPLQRTPETNSGHFARAVSQILAD